MRKSTPPALHNIYYNTLILEISMRRWVQYAGIALVLFSFYVVTFSASAVYSQQIISSDFNQYSPGIYVSPEINIWIKSTGEIQWSSNLHSVEFYLIPASKISELSQSDPGRLALPPIKYVDGPYVYLYQGITGSFYVVAVSTTNPSGNATYSFSHPPYPADELVGGPNSYSGAQHALIYSIFLMLLGFSMIFAEPVIIKTRRIKTRGGSVSESVLKSIQIAKGRTGTAMSRHRIVSMVVVIVLIFALVTVAEQGSVPKVIPVLPEDIMNGFNITGNYHDNFTFWAYSPLVSAKYHATMIGPVPQEGGINSSTIYNWDFSVMIIKVGENSSVPWTRQTLTINKVTVSIGNYSVPFHENAWDTGLLYFNGGIVTNPSGTFNTGNEYGLDVEPFNEISCNIPSGNYTISVSIELVPVTVFGPYHMDGQAKTINVTFPVYVNNSKQTGNYISQYLTL